MSKTTGKKGKKRGGKSSVNAASPLLTQIVCVVIFACVAIVGMVQVRRTMSRLDVVSLLDGGGQPVSANRESGADSEPEKIVITVNTGAETAQVTTSTTAGAAPSAFEPMTAVPPFSQEKHASPLQLSVSPASSK